MVDDSVVDHSVMDKDEETENVVDDGERTEVRYETPESGRPKKRKVISPLGEEETMRETDQDASLPLSPLPTGDWCEELDDETEEDETEVLQRGGGMPR